ncbi:MAG: hypothetical protein ACM3QS_10950, partial [Bacteroidota bacterium]
MEIELSGAEAGVAIHGIPISLNFTTSGRVRGSFALDDLRTALGRLRQIHPLMAVRLDPGTRGGRPCYTTENVPPIPVRVVERSGDEAWTREVEQEIVIPSNYQTGPMMRVVWLRGDDISDLVLVTDHITADGLAGIYALRDLLRLLADPGVKIEPCLPEKYADLVPGKMREMINAKNDASSNQPPQMAEMQTKPVQLLPLRVLPLEFSELETAALVARCKVEKTTVQGALCTAFAIPFAERQPDQPVRWVESPYNLRNRMNRPLDNI